MVSKHDDPNWRVMSPATVMMFEEDVRVKDIFPDVGKMPIAGRLREWGIDAASIPVVQTPLGIGADATARPGGIMTIGPFIEKNYPGKLAYLVLSHELAHFLQFVEGRADIEAATEWAEAGRDVQQWWKLKHERDAERWMARQGRAMGVSLKELKRHHEESYLFQRFPTLKRELAQIVEPVYKGTWPEEHGVRPMFRRPVKVRQYRRRR